MIAVVDNSPVSHESIVAFCRRWKVSRFSLFGSILTDSYSPQSDIDVLITLCEDAGLSLWDWIEMRDELQQLFGRPVDLIEESGLRNPFRRYEILRTRKVIYAG